MFTSETLTEPVAFRGTLALTNSGPVLGCPDMTQDERDALLDRVQEWWDSGYIRTALVLPFPVDVTDLRK